MSKISEDLGIIAVPLYINRLCELNVFYEARQSMQVKALTGLLRHCVPRNDEWNCYSSETINNLKKRVVMSGLESAFERKQRQTPPQEIRYNGAFDAHVVALACSEPPAGYQRWTVRLLASKIVELQIVHEASHMSIHRALKKTNV